MSTFLDSPDQDVQALRINPLDKDRWLRLARHYRQNQHWPKAELCYVGARYMDYADTDLFREWLEMFAMMKLNERLMVPSEAAMTKDANIADQAIREVVLTTEKNAALPETERDPLKHPDRRLEELRRLLFNLDLPQMTYMP